MFAGPGSPTYALRVWAATGFDDALAAVAASGGTVTFASAAALTIGVVTVPVYEIYKSGADPAWAQGTNLLERLTGLRAALIPHYDNTEGGTHSTRFCYLGERRLRFLEGALPEGSHVIGVDEHTALIFDLATGMASVLGNGTVTVRHDGESRVLPSGTVVPIAELAERAEAGPGRRTGPAAALQAPPADGVRGRRRRARSGPRVERAGHLAARRRGPARAPRSTTRWPPATPTPRPPPCSTSSRPITDWTADTLQSDDGDHARRTLRGMVLELASAARDGLADPAARLAPLVDALLERRAAARSARDFATADPCATDSPPPGSRSATARPAPSGACASRSAGARAATEMETRLGGEAKATAVRSSSSPHVTQASRGSSSAPHARCVIRSADGCPSGPSHRSAQATTNAMIGNVARPLSVSR